MHLLLYYQHLLGKALLRGPQPTRFAYITFTAMVLTPLYLLHPHLRGIAHALEFCRLLPAASSPEIHQRNRFSTTAVHVY